jgi:F-type H+-transporting ATPase subunit gamma
VSVRKFEGVDSKTDGQNVVSFVGELENAYLNGEYDKVDVVYMNFKSVSRQTLVISQFIPVLASTFTGMENSNGIKPYLFEPGPAEIFDRVLPMYLMASAQEIFSENRASEQAARVMAMQSANDNAKKLLDQLRLEFNKLRQQSITTELLDIVGGQVRD